SSRASVGAAQSGLAERLFLSRHAWACGVPSTVGSTRVTRPIEPTGMNPPLSPHIVWKLPGPGSTSPRLDFGGVRLRAAGGYSPRIGADLPELLPGSTVAEWRSRPFAAG